MMLMLSMEIFQDVSRGDFNWNRQILLLLFHIAAGGPWNIETVEVGTWTHNQNLPEVKNTMEQVFINNFS